MIGYHYTSAENYEKIKVDGLVPYWIRKRELEPWFTDGIHGTAGRYSDSELCSSERSG